MSDEPKTSETFGKIAFILMTPTFTPAGEPVLTDADAQQIEELVRALEAERAAAAERADAATALLRRFVDGINDEYHPMFNDPLYTDAERELLEEAEGFLRGR